MIAPSRTVHRRRRRRPGRAAARIVPPELALDEHLNPERTDSIMRFVKLYLGQGFFEILVAAQDATSPPAPDATGSQEASVPPFPHVIQGCCGNLEKAAHGTFVTSFKPELRISGEISQWTDRYWIAGGRSRAPCASMKFTLVISTRSHDYSLAWSTQMVLEKVHTVPFTRKF